jgi:hypothetical protein
MSGNTWAQIGSGSGIITALGGTFGQLGNATDSDFLKDAGSFLAAIGGIGVSIGTAGAFATADKDEQVASLISAGPIVAALTAQNTAPDTKPQPKPLPVETRQEAAATGAGNALGEIIAIPFKIIKAIIDAISGKA